MVSDNHVVSNVEILSVRAGLRRAGLIEIPSEQLATLADYLPRNGIEYKSVTQEQMHLKRLSRGLRPSGDRRPNSLLVYIGNDIATVEKLYELDILDQSVDMGILLGYPACCIDYYQLMKADPKSYPNWKPHFKYVPHHPCSRFCAPTVEMETILRNLKENHTSLASFGSAEQH